MKVALGVSAIKAAALKAMDQINAHRKAEDEKFLERYRIGQTGFLWWRKTFERTMEERAAIAKASKWDTVAYPSKAYDGQYLRCQVLFGVAAHKAAGTILDVEGVDLEAIAMQLEPWESERI